MEKELSHPIAAMRLHSNYTKLVRAFSAPKSVLLRTSSWNVFQDWIALTWAFLNSNNDPELFKTLGDRFSFEGGKLCSEYLFTYLELVELFPFTDILGSLYMEIEANCKYAGQYFTPMAVCRCMADMQVGTGEHFRQTAQENGFVSVCDPAVGSGAMLLAFANSVNNIDPMLLTKLRLYGIDLDPVCCNMCKIQLRANGLDTLGRAARYQHAYGPMAASILMMMEQPTPQMIANDNALFPRGERKSKAIADTKPITVMAPEPRPQATEQMMLF